MKLAIFAFDDTYESLETKKFDGAKIQTKTGKSKHLNCDPDLCVT